MKTHNLSRRVRTRKPSKKGQLWKNYEDAVRAIINQHRSVFGVEAVDPTPSKVAGKSGHNWDIEITAYTSPKRKDARYSRAAKWTCSCFHRRFVPRPSFRP